MTPNEYVILRMFGGAESVTVRQIAENMRNSIEYAKYLCAGMVSDGLLTECVDDSSAKPRPAYRLTPKSRDILADLWRGMEQSLRRRVARSRRITAIVEKRADRLGEMATSGPPTN